MKNLQNLQICTINAHISAIKWCIQERLDLVRTTCACKLLNFMAGEYKKGYQLPVETRRTQIVH